MPQRRLKSVENQVRDRSWVNWRFLNSKSVLKVFDKKTMFLIFIRKFDFSYHPTYPPSKPPTFHRVLRLEPLFGLISCRLEALVSHHQVHPVGCHQTKTLTYHLMVVWKLRPMWELFNVALSFVFVLEQTIYTDLSNIYFF